MDKIFDKFSLYDFIGYLVPGSIVTLTVNKYYFDLAGLIEGFGLSNELILGIYFVIFSYVVGIITHEFSEIIQHYILKSIWRGLPSERFLLTNDNKYSAEYRTKIKRQIEVDYGIKIEEDKKKSQEAFNQVYSLVQSKGNTEKIEIFNSIYGMCRNFLSGILLSIFMFFVTRLLVLNYIPLINEVIINILIIAVVIYLIYRRAKRFSERFVDYIFREYLNIQNKKGD